MSDTRLVPGVGRLPYPAYRGDGPYAFVSYAHADSEKVFAEIKRFNEAGFNVWYDEGIAPGNEWTDEIADALEKCSLFVVMLTPTSAPRENVLNEINFALDEKKPFLAIHLEPTELRSGLKLRIGTKQAILKYSMTDEEYEYKYTEAFDRLGLKRNVGAPAKETDKPAVSTADLDALAARFISRHEQKAAAVEAENAFDVDHGLLRGYNGTEKNVKVPDDAGVIGSRSFDSCRMFIESVDLNRAGVVIGGALSNCPNLHTVIVPETVYEIQKGAFANCPKLTLHVRRSQLPEGFEDSFAGRSIVYLDE